MIKNHFQRRAQQLLQSKWVYSGYDPFTKEKLTMSPEVVAMAMNGLAHLGCLFDCAYTQSECRESPLMVIKKAWDSGAMSPEFFVFHNELAEVLHSRYIGVHPDLSIVDVGGHFCIQNSGVIIYDPLITREGQKITITPDNLRGFYDRIR